MDIEQLRKICIAFPGATEQIQWEDDLVFKVGGKMFAVAPLEPARVWLTIKADPEAFVELTERPGIIPAPYLARAKWIAIESPEVISPAEITDLLRKSYELVCAKLPSAKRRSLASSPKKNRQSASKGPAKHKSRS
jgi:predicted DNA-binding protein (MmcQ/YjbR family)